MASHTEVEVTLEVTPEATAAVAALLDDRDGDDRLGAVAGVHAVRRHEAVELTATYHDTTDLRLARSRATLRRRTGGHDAGWHLKLPARPGGSSTPPARTEVHEPLGADDAPVPDRLLALTRSRHRGRPLVPVARLRTTRRTLELLDEHGRVLAEVADDRVTAEVADGLVAPGAEAATTWHEVEVELVDGDVAVLGRVADLLRAAGAQEPPSASKLARALDGAGALRLLEPAGPGDRAEAGTSALDVLRTALAQHVATLVAEDPMVRLDVPDAVHRARVATRRVRSVLATFRPVVDREVTDPLRDRLKELGEVLGRARDAEVLGARLRSRLAEVPPELVPGPVAARLEGRLDGAYEQALTAAVAALDDPAHLDLLETLTGLGTQPPAGPRAERPAAAATRRLVRADVRRLRRRLERVPTAPGPPRDEALHEVRKAAKRLRYGAEAVTGVHGRRAERLASRAEDLQELLGEHQDAAVALDALRVVGLDAHADGENALGYGVLAGLELAATRGLDATDPALRRALERLDKAAGRWPG